MTFFPSSLTDDTFLSEDLSDMSAVNALYEWTEWYHEQQK